MNKIDNYISDINKPTLNKIYDVYSILAVRLLVVFFVVYAEVYLTEVFPLLWPMNLLTSQSQVENLRLMKTNLDWK